MTKRKPRPPTIMTTVYFPPEMHRRLKIEAAERGLTMSEILIESYIGRSHLIDRSVSPG